MPDSPTHRPALQMPDVLADPEAPPALDGTARTRRPRWRSGLPWAATGLVLCIAGAWILRARADIPLLSDDALARAQQRWEEQGASDYDMVLDMKTAGSSPTQVHVNVRKGRVVDLRVNGEPAAGGDPRAYAVEGLFAVLVREMQLSKEKGTGVQHDHAVVRASFDARTGVPLRFLRVVPGSNRSSEWRVSSWAVAGATTEPGA